MTALYSDTYHNLERGDTEGAATVVTRLVEMERKYALAVVASAGSENTAERMQAVKTPLE